MSESKVIYVEITKYYRGMDVGKIWQCQRGKEAALCIKRGYGKLVEGPGGNVKKEPAKAPIVSKSEDKNELADLSWGELKKLAKEKELKVFGKSRETLEKELSED